jgi:hypothetical protein
VKIDSADSIESVNEGILVTVAGVIGFIKPATNHTSSTKNFIQTFLLQPLVNEENPSAASNTFYIRNDILRFNQHTTTTPAATHPPTAAAPAAVKQTIHQPPSIPAKAATEPIVNTNIATATPQPTPAATSSPSPAAAEPKKTEAAAKPEPARRNSSAKKEKPAANAAAASTAVTSNATPASTAATARAAAPHTAEKKESKSAAKAPPRKTDSIVSWANVAGKAEPGSTAIAASAASAASAAPASAAKAAPATAAASSATPAAAGNKAQPSVHSVFHEIANQKAESSNTGSEEKGGFKQQGRPRKHNAPVAPTANNNNKPRNAKTAH